MKTTLKNLLKLSPIPFTKNHKYDLQTLKIMKGLPADASCIDVGCYKGEILDLMYKVAPQGHHFGIEPIPSYFTDLQNKYASNNHCTIVPVAASDTEGVSDFNFVTSNPPYSGLKKRDYDKPNEVDTTITVKTNLLDNVIPNDLPINLIKIDVEGAELAVLKGAQNIINKYKPLVVFEHGLGAAEHYGTTPAMVHDFFKNVDMKVNTLAGYLSNKAELSKVDLENQFNNKTNYYFIAYK